MFNKYMCCQDFIIYIYIFCYFLNMNERGNARLNDLVKFVWANDDIIRGEVQTKTLTTHADKVMHGTK